jgi:YegS/Rv2252/BmrU family lipid kinase
MKHVFILNPVSGKGKANRFTSLIKEYFAAHPDMEYELIMTEYHRHATAIAQKYTAKDDVCLYACGGDGTANEVLEGLNPGVSIAIIPGGTGNDMYKSIDDRKLTDAQLLAETIEGENHMIDMGIANGHKFMNIISFGIDADINVYACDYVKVELNIPDNLVYAYSALKVATHPQTIHMNMEVDGEKMERDVIMVAVSNGKWYGSIFKPSPNADLEDGKFDICMFGKMKFPRLAYLLTKYTKGTHVKAKECETMTGQKIDINFDRVVNLQVDGENLKTEEVHIQIYPRSLSFRMPVNRQPRV